MNPIYEASQLSSQEKAKLASTYYKIPQNMRTAAPLRKVTNYIVSQQTNLRREICMANCKSSQDSEIRASRIDCERQCRVTFE